MENLAIIKFELVPSQPLLPLGMTILLDDQEVWSTQALAQRQLIEIKIDDAQEGAHRLVWRLHGKTAEHTKIDSEGVIVSDSMILVENLALDDIEITNYLSQICVYEHDFNGTGELTQDKFFGAMGCNGSVTMGFATPLYLWLLETM